MKTNLFFRASLLAGALGAAFSAHANLLGDGGFETPVVPPGTFFNLNGGSALGDWTVVGAQVSVVSTTYAEPQNGITQFESHAGDQSLDLTGGGNNGLTSGVSQSFATTIGDAYTVGFWVGRADDDHQNTGYYSVPSTVDLSIDGGVRLSYTNSDVTAHYVNWKRFSTTFVAVGTTSNVTFYNGTSSLNNNEVGLDDVSVQAVPEPASLAALGLGALGLLRRRKRA